MVIQILSLQVVNWSILDLDLDAERIVELQGNTLGPLLPFKTVARGGPRRQVPTACRNAETLLLGDSNDRLSIREAGPTAAAGPPAQPTKQRPAGACR